MKVNKPDRQLPVQPNGQGGTLSPVEQPLTESQKKVVTWLPLWICAGFLLIGNLGVAPVNGSESRWLEVVREMFLTGDYLHPTINFDPYFDKPLLGYWTIVMTSIFNSKVVTEFTARLPSALAALATLAAMISIVKRLWSTEIARLSAWIFLTFYSFAFWGRLGEADMVNLAFCTGAVAWYFAHREERSFPGYLGFFLLCFVGAHAKGMATVAVPVLAVGIDMLLLKKLKYHFNWKSLLALAIGVCVYLIPFELSRMIAPAVAPSTQNLIDCDGTLKTSGISLAIRENIIRYFAPFDHDDEGFYIYLIHIPRLTIPWSPVLILAVIDAFRRRKSLTQPEKWLCWTMIAIFLFFSISGSRRHYYILPILPYCAILTALFVDRQAMDLWVEKTKRVILWLFRFLPMEALFLCIFFGVVLMLFPSLVPKEFAILTKQLPRLLISLSAAVFILGMFMYRLNGPETPFTRLLPEKNLAKSIFSVYVILLLVFVFLIPTFSQFRTAKRSFQEMVQSAVRMNVPQENVYFFWKPFTDAVFYLGQNRKIHTVRDAEALQSLLKEKEGERILLVSQHRYFQRLPEELQKKLALVVQEQSFPWDSKGNIRENYAMRMISPANKKIEKTVEKTEKGAQ